MNAEEIRRKAIECAKEMMFKNCCNPCKKCEYGEYFLNAEVNCMTLYGYEHGFADGIEEGKQMALADLAEHDKEVRNKTIEEIYRTIKSVDDDTPECWFKCHHIYDSMSCTQCVLERAIKRMKEGGENG